MARTTIKILRRDSGGVLRGEGRASPDVYRDIRQQKIEALVIDPFPQGCTEWLPAVTPDADSASRASVAPAVRGR